MKATMRPSLRPLLTSKPTSSSRPFQRQPPTQSPIQTRPLHARVAPAPIPDPTPFVPDTQTFLTLIGRSLSTHAAKIPSWPALFSLSSAQLRDLGVEPARSRRYLLRWRDKFRRGEWGVGGDCAHVDAAGRAEVRVVEVPLGSAVERRGWRAVHGSGRRADSVEMRARTAGDASGETVGGATLTSSAGTRRIVVNVPVEAAVKSGEQAEGDDAASAPVFQPLSPEQLDRAHPIAAGIKHRGARGLVGSHVEPIKGTSGQAAIIRVKEGLWEDVRGHKIDGGERRKAEVRAKKRAAERKAGIR